MKKPSSTSLFFILGREPALSAAEIFSVFERSLNDSERKEMEQTARCSPEAVIADIPDALSATFLMDQLGGTVKIGQVVSQIAANAGNDTLVRALISGVMQSPAYHRPGRFSFGISVYAIDASGSPRAHTLRKNLKKIGMEIKRGLRERGKQVRWVTSKAPSLSSVVVETNKLLKAGAELVLLVDYERITIGHTVRVQPFRDLERRDFPRPGRDAKSGMLPPKLARMMINLAHAPRTEPLLDPFCGSGTALGEALLLGYTKLIGSDIDPRAVRNTNRNLDWLTKSGFAPAMDQARNIKLFESDIRNLDMHIEPHSIEAIVTETYLGPPQKGNESRPQLEAIRNELTPLFRDTLRMVAKLLKSDGRAVIAFPLLRYKKEVLPTTALNDLKSCGLHLVSPLPTKISAVLRTELGRNGNTLIYGRPDQKVWREIAMLEHGR